MKPKIFISYRREDSAAAAGRLYDYFERRLGAKNIFKDVFTMQIGQDFKGQMQMAIDQSDVLLLIIGPSFITLTDSMGQKRLSKEDDFIRFELEYAIEKGKPVVPVLVDGAEMPGKEDLPSSLRSVLDHHGIFLRNERWPDDIELLYSKITRIVDGKINRLKQLIHLAIGLAFLGTIYLLFKGFSGEEQNKQLVHNDFHEKVSIELREDINKLQRVIISNPENDIKHNELGQAWKKAMKKIIDDNLYIQMYGDSARFHFHKAISIKPTEHKYFYNLAVLYKDLGELDSAITYFNQAIDLGSQNPYAYHNLAHSYENKLDTGLADAAFRKAIELGASTFNHYSCYAKFQKEFGNSEGAKITYLELIKLKPEEADYYHDIAHLYADEECVDSINIGLRYFDKAIELEPEKPNHERCKERAVNKKMNAVRTGPIDCE